MYGGELRGGIVDSYLVTDVSDRTRWQEERVCKGSLVARWLIVKETKI